MAEETIKCPKCGTECNNTEKFCGNCGCILTNNAQDLKNNNVNEHSKKSKLGENYITLIFQTLSFFAIIICMFIMFYLPDVWKHIISDNSDSNVFQLIDYKIDLIALCILGIAIYLSVIAIYIISMNARNLHKMNCMFEIINERFNKLEENYKEIK